MLKTVRILATPALLVIIPVFRYLSDLWSGSKCAPYMTGFDLLIFLALPWIVGIFAGLVMPLGKVWQRVIFGIMAGVAVWPITLFTTPAGAVSYSSGFEMTVVNNPELENLQNWAIETLQNFDQEEYQSSETQMYWALGDILLPSDKLPRFLKEWISLKASEPQVMIRIIEGEPKYVSISWYLHGLMIGPANFEPDWKPWYLKPLAPGVYSYHIEK